MIQLIALLPSRCRDSGDNKFKRNMCNLTFFWYLKNVGWLCNVAILELKFCIGPNPEVLGM